MSTGRTYFGSPYPIYLLFGAEPVLFVLAGLPTTTLIQVIRPRPYHSSEQTAFGIVVVFSGNLFGSATVVGFGCLLALELIMKDTSGVAN
jgi:hypothetical protein